MEINTDTVKAANASLSSGAEGPRFAEGSLFLFASPPLILLCFLRESKLEPLTSAAQVKERGRGKKERKKRVSFHVPVVQNFI